MGPDLSQWVGRTETRSDRVTAAPMAGLSSLLDRDDPYPQTGDVLPPLWHWLYFLPRDRQSSLGSEGHARRGDFLPLSPLPRRMWAGGRLEFHRPLLVGDTLTRESRVVEVVEKTGRTGPLLFVKVRHEISKDSGVALTEEHDIVYRDRPGPDSPTPDPKMAPDDAAWADRVDPDEILLFRYSALTFNAHRIHYDRSYAKDAEGYPGLVVHGPLVATLLLELFRRHRPDAVVSGFEFRAVSPLFDRAPFWICGRSRDADPRIELWARDQDDRLAVEAEAIIQS